MSKSTEKPITANATNRLVSDTEVEGVIKTLNDIRIDGYLKGDLMSEGKVIVGEKGKIEGSVKCKNAVIEGTFIGSIKVENLLIVQEKSSIEGDVITEKLQVEPGAVYNVNCTMGNQQIKSNIAHKNKTSVKP